MNQTFEDFEIVLVDGASTDNTLEILEEYKDEPRLRWISEPDNDATEGFQKALRMTQGEYVMCLPISDCYASKTWFEKCVDKLDNDSEVSMVYGIPQYILEDSSIIGFPNMHSSLFYQPPPQKMDYFPFWLATYFTFPEITYCVKADIYKKLFPDIYSGQLFDKWNPFLKFVFLFNVNGYLPYFIPIVATYGRLHKDSRNNTMTKILQDTNKEYYTRVSKYRQDFIKGKKAHTFRDSLSNAINVIDAKKLTVVKKKIIYFRVFRKIRGNYPDPININFILGQLKSPILKLRRVRRKILGNT